MRLFVAEAYLSLVLAHVALLLPFRVLCSSIARLRIRRPRDLTPEQARALCRTIDRVAVWYPKPVECLQRSIVSVAMLRRRGIDAQLVIGHRPLPFQTHAWVELGGEVLNDRRQYCRLYTPILRVPALPSRDHAREPMAQPGR